MPRDIDKWQGLRNIFHLNFMKISFYHLKHSWKKNAFYFSSGLQRIQANIPKRRVFAWLKVITRKDAQTVSLNFNSQVFTQKALSGADGKFWSMNDWLFDVRYLSLAFFKAVFSPGFDRLFYLLISISLNMHFMYYLNYMYHMCIIYPFIQPVI